MTEWIDVSIPIRNGMPHWPDNPPLQINRTMDLACGDEATVSTVFIGSHTGTHMDAPLHFIEAGQAIHEMPLTATIGRAQVIEFTIRRPLPSRSYAGTPFVRESVCCSRRAIPIADGRSGISCGISSI
jgi:kynurenine formamidase